MKKRILCLLLCLLVLVSFQRFLLHPAYLAHPIRPEPAPMKKILLVPLDGRPPCRQFVMDAGSIASYEVIAPPSEIQDYYSLPGDTAALRKWMEENIDGSHALILSIDQLLYGGLLAAREKDASPEEVASMLAFLQRLHAEHPEIPIYAFSILPRLAPQDTIDGYHERRWLMEYSRLVGKKHDGLSVDDGEIRALEEKISSESMRKYLSHFRKSNDLNRHLSELAEAGIFERLILGQDDGERHSIPNIKKDELRRYLKDRNISEERVFLTHGADEIALTLLAEIQNRETGFRPRVFLKYNDEACRRRIMPYMAISAGDTAEEKLRMLHAVPASSPEEADFILFLSANDSDEDTLGSRRDSLRYLEQQKGRPIALVDLGRHFQKSEILMPLLIKEDYPVNSLIAYAGWNTTSNSVGTALAQACLFAGQKRVLRSREDALRLHAANLSFLQNRILEDAFYLKDVIDLVNTSLIKEGYINTADLDLEHNAHWANAMLRHAMQERIAAYTGTKAFRQPFPISTPEGPTSLRIRHLSADIGYPWPRTFEISLETRLQLEELQPVRQFRRTQTSRSCVTAGKSHIHSEYACIKGFPAPPSDGAAHIEK